MTLKAAMLSGACVVLMIGAVVGCTQPGSRTSGVDAGHAVQVTWSGIRTADVLDPAYGMKAYKVDVPAGWKFVGTILRPSGCHASPTPASGLSYTSLSPDGVTAYMQLPGVSWSWQNNPHPLVKAKCAPIRIDTAAGFLLNIAVPNLHPNATSVKVVPLPQAIQSGINAKLQQEQQQNAAMARSYGQKPQRLVLDGARVRIEYEEHGRKLEELLMTVIDCTESQTVALPMQPSYTQRDCSSRGTIISRAPKGHLDELLAQARPQAQENPAWDNRVIQDMRYNFQRLQAASNQQFQSLMGKIQTDTQHTLATGKAYQDLTRNTTNSSMKNDRDRQNAIDNSAHQTALYALDRQTFVNPATGERIEASSQYNHQWISSDNSTLIQTQDHTFDPNGVVYPIQQSWTELVPTNN